MNDLLFANFSNFSKQNQRVDSQDKYDIMDRLQIAIAILFLTFQILALASDTSQCNKEAECESEKEESKNRAKNFARPEVFKDQWGFSVNWTDPEEGWDESKRKKLLEMDKKITKQSTKVKKFTKDGFKKMAIPQELYKTLIKVKSQLTLETENCVMNDSSNGCYRLKKVNGKTVTGKSKILSSIF